MRISSVRIMLCFGAAASVAAALAASCTTNAPPNGFGGGGSSPAGSTASGGGEGGSAGQGGVDFDGGEKGAGGGGFPCMTDPADDFDKDGFTDEQGDCNDCDPESNPNAAEVTAADPTKKAVDEDCDGDVDESEPACDSGLAVDDEDPLSGARSVDLCKLSSGPGDWGVISAQWVLADGAPPPQKQLAAFHLGHGLLAGFGPNVKVRKGERLLALSSGAARQPGDPGYKDVHGFDKLFKCDPPQGFPKESPACPILTGEPHDAAGIEIKIRTPSNAHGFSFDFDFYTYEWPEYVCTEYNDFFVAILSPQPKDQMDGNISFDSQGNPVSVNNAFLDVCGCEGNPPGACDAGGKTFPCALGNVELIGTGFGFDTALEDHGATSWLVTKAPVEPNSEIVIRFSVYDSGDGVLDSTTLIDDWRWIADPGTLVGTIPIPK